MMKKEVYLFIISIIIILLLIITISSLTIPECKKECTTNKTKDQNICENKFDTCKNICNSRDRKCLSNCSSERKTCLDKKNSDYLNCQKKCSIIGKNITCLKGKYYPGETFLQGCDSGYCNYDSKVTCKKTNFCNYQGQNLTENICKINNGLYQQLCNGLYYDIVCSADNFCLCDGKNNYSCPGEYYCLDNFSLSLTRRGQTITGWKTLLGFPLGDIGICVKKPILNNCGNNLCENICIEKDCSNTENFLNCPQDCKI